MTNELPGKMAALYEALAGKGDVHVLHLYRAVTGRDLNDQVAAQQYLGPYLTRLNRRLRKQGVRAGPGALKGSYRILNLAD